MDGPETRPNRIMVVARPTLGRFVELALRGAGYEVHRTPEALDLQALVARLRPHLAIVALDLPWVDALDAVHRLTAEARPLPLLLLGDAESDSRIDGMPRLPLTVDGPRLLAAVSSLLALNDLQHGK